MDETQISITVKPIYLERLLYWIIIIVLAVLLALAWMKDSCDAPIVKDNSANNAPAAVVNNTPPPQNTVAQPEPPKATCVDGTKNQDETDVDCGGSACTKCGSGKACTAASDCIGGYCTSNVCTSSAPTVLTGKVGFALTDVQFSKTASGTVKVTGISYRITNGLDEDTDGFIIKVFAKNKAGTRCLNQQDSGTCDDSYAEFSNGGIKSGKNATNTHAFENSEYTTLMGRYLIEDNGYTPGDASTGQFQVVAYLYDDAGNQIDGKAISDSFLVKP